LLLFVSRQKVRNIELQSAKINPGANSD